MKKLCFIVFVIFLIVLAATACGGNTEKRAALEDETKGSKIDIANIPAGPDILLKEGWPADKVPDELPEYTAGMVTASAVDGEGVLTIKVKDTGQSDIDDYLGKLQSAGWIVTSNNYETEAVLGLYTATFALQAGDTILQIDVYTAEAGDWPADKIPPDILKPISGTLVGKVELLETMDNAWYFNYTYNGVDEAGAREYMELLTEKGWSGDGGQLYKSFKWKGKSYAADIEIYETVETRTTFTCNFYLSQ